MASSSTNMTLKLWDSGTDYFNYTDLYGNFSKIDAHDHTTGKGVQISNSALAGSISNDKFVAGVNPVLSQTLPTTGLFDGYTVNLTDSTTAPNWVWQMRYTSTTSRWEFVGGSWYQVSSTASVALTSSSYANPTNCVALTMPSFLSTGSATCIFRVESFATGFGPTTPTAVNIGMSFLIGSTPSSAVNEWNQSTAAIATTGGAFSGFRSSTITGATAGSILTAQFKTSATGASVTQHSLSIRPTYIDIT